MTQHRIASVAAGILLLGGLYFFGACLFTGFDAKWVLAILFIGGFVGITMWTDKPVIS